MPRCACRTYAQHGMRKFAARTSELEKKLGSRGGKRGAASFREMDVERGLVEIRNSARRLKEILLWLVHACRDRQREYARIWIAPRHSRHQGCKRPIVQTHR